jgi:hypothetical protein
MTRHATMGDILAGVRDDAALFRAAPTAGTLADPAVQARLAEMGFEPLLAVARAAFPARLGRQQARWRATITATGARLD